jgi:tungstate transport system ATP-binding protein
MADLTMALDGIFRSSPPAEGPPLLPVEVRGLVFAAGNKRLIDGIDLTLAAGALTVIMGPNGAGKSLLLKLLHGLIQPAAGSVRWGGRPTGEAVRRRQALVFQRPVLLRRSVAANVRFVLQLRGADSVERCRELLEYVDLASRAEQPARRLSGGEQQRLALARALALEPEVLLLDEPTANLDPAATAAIEAIVQSVHRLGTKVLFVTHDLGQARRLADEVVFLHRGRVLEHTPAPQFFDQPVSREARDYLAGRLVL